MTKFRKLRNFVQFPENFPKNLRLISVFRDLMVGKY